MKILIKLKIHIIYNSFIYIYINLFQILQKIKIQIIVKNREIVSN